MATQENQSTQVFYIPASSEKPHPQLVDELHECEDGKIVGLFSHLTQQEHSQSLGVDVQVIDYDTFKKLRDDSYVTAPRPITKERFYEALDCLPPVRWGNYQGIESFRFLELYCGNVTSVFARKGDQFWEFRDRIDISNETLVRKVEAASAAFAAQGTVECVSLHVDDMEA
ncbi:hypothetical protein [Diaphorobacter sp. J5-51]|uniref:hypothetical protein n=1 Tax=Diaphorobacter sp. J5-51 TaxID=680496 RepID=UPI000642C42C|nr:hypothetical protein [Diaphorobacter sp. J5-51]KLR59291.1 hypothetical protein OX89_02530 [Diaphorobacter sp. J5-51]